MFTLFVQFLFLALTTNAQVPQQPIDSQHPGSSSYAYTLKKENFQHNGRRVDVYLPAESRNTTALAPVIIFGHGQATDVAGYDLTFRHLARKGVAVIHPTYDSGFFDQDWRRMARDFNQLTRHTLQKYSDYIDANKVIYSGHSKGAYIALMAAGAPELQNPISSLVLFAPAGYDAEYLQNIEPSVPVTLVWSDGDTVIKQSLITEIYDNLPSQNKQWLLLKSYSSMKADHFYPLSKSYFFGGQNGVTAYHYFAVWKWLVGAAWDLMSNERLSNTFIYGDEAPTTGIEGLHHIITRNWSKEGDLN